MRRLSLFAVLLAVGHDGQRGAVSGGRFVGGFGGSRSNGDSELSSEYVVTAATGAASWLDLRSTSRRGGFLLRSQALL